DPQTRRDVLCALGLIGAQSGAGLLRRELENPDPAIAGAAVWALARLGDRTAVPALLAMLRKGDSDGMVAWALGMLGAPAAVPLLQERLDRLLEHPAPRNAQELGLVIWALGQLSLGPGRGPVELSPRTAAVNMAGWILKQVGTPWLRR